MKAKDLLKEIIKAYPDVVAIAQDFNGEVFIYNNEIPKPMNYTWTSKGYYEQFSHENFIEWDSENCKENIITINDLKDELN